MLTDRLLVHDGGLLPDSIEDFAGPDSRRATIGLPPMTEYVQLLRVIYRVPVAWPPLYQSESGFRTRRHEISLAFCIARPERWTKVQLRCGGKFCIQGIRLGPLASLKTLAHPRSNIGAQAVHNTWVTVFPSGPGERQDLVKPLRKAVQHSE